MATGNFGIGRAIDEVTEMQLKIKQGREITEEEIIAIENRVQQAIRVE